MKLHANAALSLNGRRELCRQVVERERTLTQAAEAAGVSVRCARQWVARYLAEGELGLLDRSSAPRSIPHRTSEQRVQVIAALRRLRFTGPESAQTLGMALLHRLGRSHPAGNRQAWPAWPGAGPALRARAARRSGPDRCQEGGSEPGAGTQRHRQAAQPAQHLHRGWPTDRRGRLGTRAYRHR